MRSALTVLLAVGCGGGTSGDTTATSTGSGSLSTGSLSTGTPTTGTPMPDFCPDPYVSIAQAACASSTRPEAADGGGNSVFDLQLTVPVTAVAQPGATDLPAVRGFPACDGTAVPAGRRIELLDDTGARWVVGWDVGTGEVDAVLAGLPVGAPLSLVVRSGNYGYGWYSGLALLDATGPLALFDAGAGVVEAGGLSSATEDVGCVGEITAHYGGSADVYRVSLSSSAGGVHLFAGERGVVPHPGRALEAEIGDSYWITGCADGCGYTGFAVWAQVP